jgi:hypothetical protein
MASLLVDPAVDGTLVAQDFAVFEPQGNLLLGALDRVAAVADIATDILPLAIVLDEHTMA